MSSCSKTESCECGTTTHFLTPTGDNNLCIPVSNSQEEPTIYPLDPEVLVAVSGDPIYSGILDEEGQIVLIDNDIAVRTGTTHFYVRIDPTEAKGSVTLNGVVVWVANEVTSTDSYVQVPIRVGLNIDYQIILTEGEVDIYYAGEVVGLDVPTPGWMEAVIYDPAGVEDDAFKLANMDTVVTGAQLDNLYDAFDNATGTGDIVLETGPALVGPYISGDLAMAGVTSWTIPDITPSWSGSAQVKWQTALGLAAASVEGTAILSTGETGGSKFLREDGDGTCSWQAIAGGGDALTASPLSQFAATTSAQLAGVISDETGTGALVFADSPTLVTPAIGTPASGVLTNCTGLPAGSVTGLSTVATSGDYDDLSNKPSIPATVDELTDLDTTVTGAELNVIKTKVDGIEAGADVTDAANVTAAGALMDSEVTNLDQVKAFDAADYATAAQGALADSAIQPVDLAAVATSGEGTAILSTGETGGSKFLREDGDGSCSWQAIAGGGDALTGSPLSQFAATTSSQLAGVISDETGTGALVFANSPTLVTPALGTPASGVLTNCTGLPAGSVTGLATVATSGDYDDLINAPSIPAVNSSTVQAAGALMDSEVTNLAQVKAFNSSDYATSAQGAKADTATQPGDLATVATSGDYDDLTNKPIPPVQIPALAGNPTSSNGATVTSSAGEASGMSFPDTGDTSVVYSVVVPSGSAGTFSVSLRGDSSATAAASEEWAVSIEAKQDDEASYGSAVAAEVTITAASTPHTITSGTVTPSGSPTSGDIVYIRITRDVSEESTSSDGDVLLREIIVTFD